MHETRRLAEYATELDIGAVPERVRRHVSQLVLDQLGCQVAGVQMPWSARVARAVEPLSADGRATVVGQERRIASDGAAFLNSSLGHSNESDDTHLKTPNHPGAVIIPAALAVGEETGATGEELLKAIVAGYEVMLRISYAVSPHLIALGHHPPPAVGPFGAAVAAAVLYGLDAEQTVNALAAAGSHAAGLLEYTQTGGSVKRMHCAIPAQAGVRSALLALHGLTGPPTVLEGARGFLEVFARRYDASWLTRDLGVSSLIPETSIKFYSCCYLIHPALDAYSILSKRHGFGASDIESMVVTTRSQAVKKHVGAIKEPPDILGAQFSTSFCLSLMAHTGSCGFWDFVHADLGDPSMLDLARRIDMVVEDETEDAFETGIHLGVRLRDGQVLEHVVAHARGEPENPLTPAQIEAKFLDMAVPLLGAESAERVRALAADGIEHLTSARDLMEPLRGPFPVTRVA